jgi:hypothetical protein
MKVNFSDAFSEAFSDAFDANKFADKKVLWMLIHAPKSPQ